MRSLDMYSREFYAVSSRAILPTLIAVPYSRLWLNTSPIALDLPLPIQNHSTCLHEVEFCAVDYLLDSYSTDWVATTDGYSLI